jgi:hypothetical protein
MPWTPDEAERHTHKATTPELKDLWAKVATSDWKIQATKPAPSEKRTLLSRDKRSAAFNGPYFIVGRILPSQVPPRPTASPHGV